MKSFKNFLINKEKDKKNDLQQYLSVFVVLQYYSRRSLFTLFSRAHTCTSRLLLNLFVDSIYICFL